MHPNRTSILPACALVSMLLSAALFAQQPATVDDKALRDAGKTGRDWLSYGLTPGETRYSPLARIDAGNVQRLALAWAFDVGPGGGKQEATPIVWNGVLYGQTTWSVVFAVDARTGKERWRWDPEVNQTAVRRRICCGVVSRGVAIYKGKIIAPIIDGRLQALDAETGRPVWEARVSYPQDHYTVTMAPRIAGGKVIIGAAGAEYPVRGFFDAYDAETGHRVWRFWTVPGDPAKPFESAAMKMAAPTWSGDWWKLGGGATVWDAVSYDPESDLVYVGTGNGGPWPEVLRKSTGLDNLFVCAVLAVKASTGELKWHFQFVPGDSWDYDSVQQLTLADLTINGRVRKVLMQANKNGFYYVLDRLTGAFISGEPYVRVTWAKGLDPKTGRPIVHPDAVYGTESIQLSPSGMGAHNWSPMSFNPKTGLVYVPASPNQQRNYAVDANFVYKPGEQNIGLARGAALNDNPKPAPPAVGPAPVEGQLGALIAWDPVAQQERWRAPRGGGIGGGTVTTAGNLVLQVTPEGQLVAYRADTGQELWVTETGLAGNAPPVTYEIDGTQYVSFIGGLGQGFNRPDGTPQPPPKLLTYTLDGK